MKYIGHDYPVENALLKVTGEPLFCDDLAFPNPLVGKILYSPYGHARILSMDTAEAEALPGVHAVLTYKNNPYTDGYNCARRERHAAMPMDQYLFPRELLNVGTAVAAVAAEDEATARKALKLIKVDYEELPVVLDAEEALKEGAPLVRPEGNLVDHFVTGCGDAERGFEEADLVVSDRLKTQAVAHCAIEPHVAVAYWNRKNELEVWCPNQGCVRTKMQLAMLFGLPESKVSYHSPIIGGAFGGKDGVTVEPYAAILSKLTGRYVKIRMSRDQCFTSVYTRHDTSMYTSMGFRRDGTMTALSFRCYLNSGAYAAGSVGVLRALCGKMFKLYKTPNIAFDGSVVYTNGITAYAMRGYGSPQVFAALETLMDKAAEKLGMDPVELRMKNLVEPFGKDGRTGESYVNARVRDCVEKGAKEFDWANRRATAKQQDDSRYKYGVGMAAGLHGNGVAPFNMDMTVASLALQEDGCVILRTSCSDHGSGTYILHKMIAGEALKTDPDNILLIHSDSTYGEYDLGAGASRNTWTGGRAVQKVAEKLRDTLMGLAAEKDGTAPEQVELTEEGLYLVKTTGSRYSRDDLAAYAMYNKHLKIVETVSYSSEHNAGSYGAHFAYVRVDTREGGVEILDYLAMCDVGTALNPMLLEGQLNGALQMGLGMLFREKMEMDEKGRLRNNSFKKYKMLRAGEMPANMRVKFIEEFEEDGPFGGKSIGEASIVPIVPAMINAISHALGGCEFHSLPITPEMIKEASRG